MKVFYSRIRNETDQVVYIPSRGIILKKRSTNRFFYDPTRQAVSRAERRLLCGKSSELYADDALAETAVAEGEAYWKDHKERTLPEPSKKFKKAARALFDSVNYKIVFD